LLKILSQEDEQEMNAALNRAAEGETYNMNFVELYEELESLERRVMVQRLHIQQAKLEAYEGAYHLGEQLEGFGYIPAQEEMTKAKLSEEEDKKQLIDETTGLESAAEWKISATIGYEDTMGDQNNLPFEEEVQQRRLHKKSQPVEKLDRVIEEIRRLMLRSTKEISKGKLTRGDPSTIGGKKKQKQQQHSWRGARGQPQRTVWDPGGFQCSERGAHDFPSTGV
jgi:hypothetical protein